MSDNLEAMASENQLLSYLPDEVKDNVLRNCVSMDLPLGQTLIRAGEPIEQVFFICGGIASILVTSRSGKVTESGIVGREGFVPAGVLVDAETSFTEVIMQVPGSALAMEASTFQELRKRHRLLEQLMTCAQHVLRTQIECTLLSNTTQTVNQRLARWLLICHDRVNGNQLNLTHDFLSLMLAVRRPSVTDSLHFLEGEGFIRSERAKITIRDRKALEAFAGDIYGLPEEENARVFKRFETVSEAFVSAGGMQSARH